MGSHPPAHTVTVRVSMEVITSHDVEVLRTGKSYGAPGSHMAFE